MRSANSRKIISTEEVQRDTSHKPPRFNIQLPVGDTSPQSTEWDFIGELNKLFSVIPKEEVSYDFGDALSYLRVARVARVAHEKAAEKEFSKVPPNLTDALADLHAAREEAADEEFTSPSDLTLQNAERLLRAMHEILPCRYEVYPMPDGEIAIDAPMALGISIVAMCEPDGNALCFVHTDQSKERRRFPIAELPNDFLRHALLELGSASK